MFCAKYLRGFNWDLPPQVTNSTTHGTIVSYYPNPVKDKLHIELDLAGFCTLELSDITGHTIKKQDAISDHHVMDMSKLQPGVYFLHITNMGEKEKKTYKIIKI